jgi:hypothetical protein
MTNKNNNRASKNNNQNNATSDVEYSNDINIRSEITKKDLKNKQK